MHMHHAMKYNITGIYIHVHVLCVCVSTGAGSSAGAGQSKISTRQWAENKDYNVEKLFHKVR